MVATIKVIIVENPRIESANSTAAWGQSQIVEASHVIILLMK
jgi:hypothetical protein